MAALHRALGDAECHRCHLEHSGVSRDRARLRFTHDVLPAASRGDCVACHGGERPRDRLHAQAGDACGSCHRGERWKPASFDHDRYFRFDANHPPRCGDCHDPGGDLRSYDCTRCHEHSRARIIAEHREERVTDLDRCARCHRSGSEHEGGGGGEGGEGDEGGEGEED